MDLRKIKGLQILKSKGIKRLDDGFAVKSQNSKRYYFVDNVFKCTCPDCQINHSPCCKHAFAVKYYLGVEKPDGTIEKIRLSGKQAWSVYNKAQQEEIKMFDELLKDLVANIEDNYTFGRPSLSRKESLFCAIQKVYSQLSSRRAKSLFNKSVEAEQIKHAPHFNAVSKLLNKESAAPLLQELLVKSAKPLKAVETKFAIDSSGFRTTRFSPYCKDKHRTGREHQYIKAHICTGVKTNVITGATITMGNAGDSPQLPELVEQTSQNFEAEEYSADKAYSSRKNFEIIDEQGATPYIPFKENAKGRSKAKPIWKKMYYYFKLNQEEFMQHYHLRSNCEATFSMVKSKLGDTVKSKNFTAQKNELLCKLIAHNVIVLISEIHELGIKAKF